MLTTDVCLTKLIDNGQYYVIIANKLVYWQFHVDPITRAHVYIDIFMMTS